MQHVSWENALDRHLALASRPLITIVGATASGKTSLSIEMAKRIEKNQESGWTGAEIVNGDSRQLFRGFDIGTAKITTPEMQGIPHHLIDVLDPKDQVSVAWYQKEALRVIDEILARHHVPLLVGGSMLYVASVTDGLRPLPKIDDALRTAVEAEYDRDAGESLYHELFARDPKTASQIHRHNKPYLVRGIELLRTQKTVPSSLKVRNGCPYDLLIFGTEMPREEINRRIDLRTHEMLRGGWIREVERLIDQGITPKDPAMKSQGYNEIAAWLAGGSEDQDELEQVIAAKVRQFAKRQMTWWRSDQRIRWVMRGHTAQRLPTPAQTNS